MANLLNEIRELEKEAKEASYWKGKYEELVIKIREATSILSSNVSLPTKGRKRQNNNQSSKIIEAIYVKLKADDSLQAGTDYIEKTLRDNDMPCHSAIVNTIRNGLREKKDISFRKDGKKIFLYYQKPTFSNDIKIEKFSYMG